MPIGKKTTKKAPSENQQLELPFGSDFLNQSKKQLLNAAAGETRGRAVAGVARAAFTLSGTSSSRGPQPATHPNRKYLTLKEAADRLNIPYFKIRRAAKLGIIPTYTLLNSRTLVILDEIEAIIQSSNQGAQDESLQS